jgi:DNA-binding Xre family transcriptional regulator
VAVDYEWRLRVLMAEHGMFKAIDLAPRLAEHGIRLSDSQVWRLVTGRPERLNLRLFMVLCEILDCEPGELVRRTDARDGRSKNPPAANPSPRISRPRQCDYGERDRDGNLRGVRPAGATRPSRDRRLPGGRTMLLASADRGPQRVPS